MSASKRFNISSTFERRLRELERIVSETVIVPVEDLDTNSLNTNQVLYVDPISKQIVSSSNFYYDGSSVGIRTTPHSHYVLDVDGNTRITGETMIDGSLVVMGSLTTINTIEFDVSTNYININQGQQGTPPITLKSGIRVNRGDFPDYLFEFSEEHDLFRVGVSGNGMDPVTERELMFQNRAIPVWDGSGDFQGRLTYDEGFVLDNSGHLGIGVNDFNNIKEANLFIEDSEPLVVIYSNTENDVGIELIRGENRIFGTDSFTDWRIRSSSGSLYIQSGFGGDPAKNVIQFTGFDSGRLGIGGITPSEALDVNGVSNFRDDILLNCNNAVDVSNILFCDGSDYNTTITSIDTSLNDHETRIAFNEDDISRIDISLSNHELRIATNEEDITRIDTSLNDHETRITVNENDILDLSDEKFDKSGGLINGNVTINDDLDLSCNLINDVSGINFCDGTYIGQGNSFDISTSQILKVKNTNGTTLALNDNRDFIFLDGSRNIDIPNDLNNPGGNEKIQTHVLSSSGASAGFYCYDQKESNSARVEFYKNESGDVNAKSDISSNSTIGYVGFKGMINDSYSLVSRILGNTSASNATSLEGVIDFQTKELTDSLSTKMRIAGNGNVGIGTIDPSRNLHIKGRTLIEEIPGFTSEDQMLDIQSKFSQLRMLDIDDNKFVHFSYSGGKLGIRDSSYSSIPVLTVDGNTSNIGINTFNAINGLTIEHGTTPVTDSGYALSFSTDNFGLIGEINGNTGNNSALWIKNDTPGATRTNIIRAQNNGQVGFNSDLQSTDNEIIVDINGKSTINMPSNFWQKDAGFFGIGSNNLSNPQNLGQLEHAGSFELSITAGGYRNSSETWTSYELGTDLSGASQISLNPNGSIKFKTQSIKNTGDNAVITQRMVIDSEGNLGVNTPSPLKILGSRYQFKDGSIISGDTTTVSGNVALYPYYQDDNYTCCYGAKHSSGGPLIGYGVRSLSSIFVSIDDLPLYRTYFHIDQNMEFFSAGEQTVNKGVEVTGFTKVFDMEGNTGNLTITGTYNPFTGSHRVNTISNELVDKDKDFEGLLVNVVRSSKIKIINTQIFVELTTTEYSKNVYGIVYLVNNKKDILVNSVGDGSIWVSNKNGNIESGDFVISSTLPGYAQAQMDGFFANYTVAKIMIECDFTQPQQPQLEYNEETDEWLEVKDNFGNTVMENEYDIRYLNDQGNTITQTEYDTILSNGGNAYIAAFLPCIYHCG